MVFAVFEHRIGLGGSGDLEEMRTVRHERDRHRVAEGEAADQPFHGMALDEKQLAGGIGKTDFLAETNGDLPRFPGVVAGGEEAMRAGAAGNGGGPVYIRKRRAVHQNGRMAAV